MAKRSDESKAPEVKEQPADSTVPRTIALEPAEWGWATWRPRQVQLRPDPRPFDPQDCTARLAKVRTKGIGRPWTWETANIADSLTQAEAQFWFTAMCKAASSYLNHATPKSIAAELAQRNFDQPIRASEIRQGIKNDGHVLHEWLMAPLANLMPFPELAAWLQDDELLGSWIATNYFLAGFVKHVLPYVSDDEVEHLRRELRPRITPGQWPQGTGPVNAFHFAARLGMHKELAELVESWADDFFLTRHTQEYYQIPQGVIFGLGDGRAVQAHMRRLKLRLKTPQQVRAWLACTEFEGLDFVRDCIIDVSNRAIAEELLASFALVQAPEAAPFMLELSLDSKAQIPARQWLEENPRCTIAGLIPLAGKGSKVKEAATQLLRDLRKRGHQDFMERYVSQLIADRAGKVREHVLEEREATHPAFDDRTTPAWLSEALGEQPAGKVEPPLWLRIAELPPAIVGQQRLNDEQLGVVLRQLRTANLQQPPALLAALKQHGDRTSLDALAWDIFERWQRAGSPAKDKWALSAVGFLGGDVSVLKLAPLIRVWPGQSQHQRAAFGLECLRAVGSDTALMQLSDMAGKIKFQKFKLKAAACMDAIARERGLSRVELEDRIVPDCELDEHGSRIFDFGPRRFAFALDKQLKPMVRDETGKLKADLPKPAAKDDQAKAVAAIGSWKLIKKNLREVLRAQAPRLERAMITGRRWPRDRFETLLVRHPLMTHLVRRLLWGVYGPQDQLLTTFRVTEERDYADARDQPCDPGPAERIGIVHPAHLDPADAGVWGEVFSDYEILSPFPQLGRPIYKVEPREESQTELSRFNHVQVDYMVLGAILHRQGWSPGVPQNSLLAGGSGHHFTFANSSITAVVEYESNRGDDTLRIKRCYFLAGIGSPALLKLGDVHPVVLSETIRYLRALPEKGK